jgi:hypothetical protein
VVPAAVVTVAIALVPAWLTLGIPAMPTPVILPVAVITVAGVRAV